MEVILTHEHTDFDALASLLGASLLFPDAHPVVPHQLNRNVRDFLALYKNQLPFITDEDLPRESVSRAILVDARAVNWVKGMSDETEWLIIDHHSADTEPEPGHTDWSEPVGANTTLLVEHLIKQGHQPKAVHATLLALGIHEDTGSLTYVSTTHRDVAALAWLLEPEHNVNMEVLAHFLNHPLSEEQRQLLADLIKNSTFHEVAGHVVALAPAQADGFSEQISSLANRLLDFHETDALFIVIDLGSVIQVVARSTTDAIHVGQIARALGGGGHARAAAAAIDNDVSTLSDVQSQIQDLLHQHTQAAVKVETIMSVGHPHVVSPDMTINEAAVLMRRYGHEGFPVIKTENSGTETLLGVITRREADRAISHRMGEHPVRRFMRAGSVTVRPQDSIGVLRKRMIHSGWGQIPVVDEHEKIIGIVTRTDLIKLWDDTAGSATPAPDVAQRLQNLLPARRLALLRLIGREVESLGYAVYVVGGFVRDLLINGPDFAPSVVDIDIVLEGDAIEFAYHLESRYGGRIVPHQRFNTAKWILDDSDHPVDHAKLDHELNVTNDETPLPTHLDFVTARTEFYTAPTVLPTVEDSSIKLDLHRRDFTINTLALCLLPDRWGELLDFYGGVNDLHSGVIRVLHSLSFVDDPTRILRAVRYEQRFQFDIEERTLELLCDATELLDRVTPDRIRHELERILQEEKPEVSLHRLNNLGVLQRIHPSLQVDAWIDSHFDMIRSARVSGIGAYDLEETPIERLYWGILAFRLDAGVHVQLQERLNLRGETRQMMQGLEVLHSSHSLLSHPGTRISSLVHVLDRTDATARAVARLVWRDEERTATRLDNYETEWQSVRPQLDGHQLAQLDIRRGPVYSKILNVLRAARLDGEITSIEEEKALARSIAARAER